MKTTARLNLPPPKIAPTEDEIRDYAYHLYEQSGRIPGHDAENWLEARACLLANIPAHRSRVRLHRHLHGLGPAEQAELCAFSPEARNIAT